MTTRRFRIPRPRPRRPVPDGAVLSVGPVRSGKSESALGPAIGDWDGPVLVTTRRRGDPPQHPGQLQLPGTGTDGRR